MSCRSCSIKFLPNFRLWSKTGWGLHRIGVFLYALLPARTVGFYPTLFTLTSFIPETFKVSTMTIGGIVSVTLSRSWRPLAAIAFAPRFRSPSRATLIYEFTRIIRIIRVRFEYWNRLTPNKSEERWCSDFPPPPNFALQDLSSTVLLIANTIV